jgi:hypothetical protein
MGLNLVSYSATADRASLPGDVRGATLRWPEVLAIVQREWDAKPLAMATANVTR